MKRCKETTVSKAVCSTLWCDSTRTGFPSVPMTRRLRSLCKASWRIWSKWRRILPGFCISTGSNISLRTLRLWMCSTSSVFQCSTRLWKSIFTTRWCTISRKRNSLWTPSTRSAGASKTTATGGRSTRTKTPFWLKATRWSSLSQNWFNWRPGSRIFKVLLKTRRRVSWMRRANGSRTSSPRTPPSK